MSLWRRRLRQFDLCSECGDPKRKAYRLCHPCAVAKSLHRRGIEPSDPDIAKRGIEPVNPDIGKF